MAGTRERLEREQRHPQGRSEPPGPCPAWETRTQLRDRETDENDGKLTGNPSKQQGTSVEGSTGRNVE